MRHLIDSIIELRHLATCCFNLSSLEYILGLKYTILVTIQQSNITQLQEAHENNAFTRGLAQAQGICQWYTNLG
jgi:hypothetical protein